jgi:hypothetical protein
MSVLNWNPLEMKWMLLNVASYNYNPISTIFLPYLMHESLRCLEEWPYRKYIFTALRVWQLLIVYFMRYKNKLLTLYNRIPLIFFLITVWISIHQLFSLNVILSLIFTESNKKPISCQQNCDCLWQSVIHHHRQFPSIIPLNSFSC